MRQPTRTLYLLLLLPGVLTACATSGTVVQHEQSQTLAVERWHRCVDNSLVRLSADHKGLDGLVEETLIVCQGHKSDVLATFPTRMEKAVDDLMVQQVYETSLTQLAGSEIQGAALSALDKTLLGRH